MNTPLILLTNDDGIHAPGLRLLAESLAPLGEVVVYAPDRQRSAVGHGVSLHQPLRIIETQPGWNMVDGTPADCLILAVRGLLGRRPDLVVSGINAGANMGDDTVYSGTVAAATEGFLLGIPSLAVSLANIQSENFQTAADFVAGLVQRFAAQPFPEHVLLNVNVPDVLPDAINGVEVTRLGRRHKAQDTVKTVNPRNQTMYWVGAAGAAQDAGPGTDFYAVSQGKVSITPLQLDLTRYVQMGLVEDWLSR